MNIALAKSDTGRAAQTVFAAARDRLPGVGKIAEFRRQAFESFERSGLPHRRIEEWKYTDLRAMMRQVLPLAPVPNASAIERARAALSAHAIEGAAKLVLVDGVFSHELSDEAEAGVSVVSLGEALENGRDDLLNASATDALILLNAALATDGVVVTVADGATPARPIQVIHIATAASASIVTRSHIRLGRAARVTLIETFASTDAARNYQAHDAVMLTVGD